MFYERDELHVPGRCRVTGCCAVITVSGCTLALKIYTSEVCFRNETAYPIRYLAVLLSGVCVASRAAHFTFYDLRKCYALV